MRAARSRPRRRPTLLLAASVAALATAIACSTSPASRTDAPGDTVIDDTRDQPRPPPAPPAPPTDASSDAPYVSDAYAGDGGALSLDVCNGCTCSPDAHFCFGGGAQKGLVAPAAADGGDGGAPACTVSPAGSVALGCNAFPTACATNRTCACVLGALQPQFGCYLVCRDDFTRLLVYCPSP